MRAAWLFSRNRTGLSEVLNREIIKQVLRSYCITQQQYVHPLKCSQWDHGLILRNVQNFLKKKEGIYSPLELGGNSCVTKTLTERECPTMYTMGMGGYLKRRNRRSGDRSRNRKLVLSSFTMALGAFAIGIALATVTFLGERFSAR